MLHYHLFFINFVIRNEKMKKPILLAGDSAKKVLAVGIFGCIVVMCLLFIILYSWKRLKRSEGKL
jgi:hypothetical protein